MSTFLELCDVEDSTSDIYIFGRSLNESQNALYRSGSRSDGRLELSRNDFSFDASCSSVLFDVTENSDADFDSKTENHNYHNIIAEHSDQSNETCAETTGYKNPARNPFTSSLQNSVSVTERPQHYERCLDFQSIANENANKVNKDQSILLPLTSIMDESYTTEFDQKSFHQVTSGTDSDRLKANFAVFARRKVQASMRIKKNQTVGRSA